MPRPPLPYKEALAWLYGLQRFGIKLGLENIRRLIAELHIDLRGSRVIHVAGTNGKGSVCAMIDSILREHGRRTGLFTSPHLVTFRERISVNGEMISQDAVANGLTAIRGLVADWNPHPTFFEIITALALKYFSEEKIDIVVLETGMGGRLDATNAVQSDVSVQRPEAEEMIRGRAAECEAPIEFVTASYDKTPIALAGSYQKQNAALAIAALRVANIDINDSSIARGLASVDWPARFQHWNDRIVIDGAHNPAAAYVLAQTWRETFGDQRAMLILAIFSDKDLRGICEALAPISDYVFLPKIRSERAAPPDELAKVLSTITPSLPYSITESIGEALAFARSKPNPILITGSLHFAGEVLAHLRGEPAAFEECAQ